MQKKFSDYCVAFIRDPVDFLYDFGLAAYPLPGDDLLASEDEALLMHPELHHVLLPMRSFYHKLAESEKGELHRQAGLAAPALALIDDDETETGWWRKPGSWGNLRVSHALQLLILGCSTPLPELNLAVQHPKRLRLSLPDGTPASLVSTVDAAKTTVTSCPLCSENVVVNQLQASRLIPSEGYKRFLSRKLLAPDFTAVEKQIKANPRITRYLNIRNDKFIFSLRNGVFLCPTHTVWVNARIGFRKDGASQWCWDDHAVSPHRCHSQPVSAEMQRQFDELRMEPYLTAHNELMQLLGPYEVRLRANAEEKRTFSEEEFDESVQYWREYGAQKPDIGRWRAAVQLGA